MFRKGFRMFVLIFVFVCLGAIPRIFNYQGKLTDSTGAGINDTVDVEFRLYGVESGGSPLWVEPHSGGQGVRVRNGLFSVELGGLVPFPDSVDFSAQYWLEVVVDGEVLSPRERLVAVPYSLRAQTVERAVQSIIGGYALAPDDSSIGVVRLDVKYDNITIGVNEFDKLYVKDGSIGSAQIADGSITLDDIAAGVVVSGSGVSGKVAFWTGGQSVGFDSTFHWDIVNRRLGIGTTSPSTKVQVVGTVRASGFSAADGTALSPSYYFANDGDVGLFRPSNNQIAITTGGVERVRITDAGNVGLGVSAPNARLDVSGQMYSRLFEIPWPSR